MNLTRRREEREEKKNAKIYVGSHISRRALAPVFAALENAATVCQFGTLVLPFAVFASSRDFWTWV